MSEASDMKNAVLRNNETNIWRVCERVVTIATKRLARL